MKIHFDEFLDKIAENIPSMKRLMMLYHLVKATGIIPQNMHILFGSIPPWIAESGCKS